MKTLAAVMTGSGTSAIATVEVLGPNAFPVLSEVFSPNGPNPLDPQIGTMRVGTLRDDDRVVDQVTLACEGPQHWALHCHGNPLIVEAAMTLLENRGITLVPAQDMESQRLAQGNLSLCQQEARLALAGCKSLLGARLLDHQILGGLTVWAQQAPEALENLRSQCRSILAQSDIARFILDGVTVVLIGPPNSGKSTLLNSLSGQDAAVVTHVKGTTRDWVEAHCRTERLALHLIDTAGLDSALHDGHLDAESQRRTLEVMDRAQIILLVLDGAAPNTQVESRWLDGLPPVPCVTVLNKSDLPGQLDLRALNLDPSLAISISAEQQTGLDQLLDLIEQTLGIEDFDVTQPLCVTSRQRECIHQVLTAQTVEQSQNALESLLTGS